MVGEELLGCPLAPVSLHPPAHGRQVTEVHELPLVNGTNLVQPQGDGEPVLSNHECKVCLEHHLIRCQPSTPCSKDLVHDYVRHPRFEVYDVEGDICRGAR